MRKILLLLVALSLVFAVNDLGGGGGSGATDHGALTGLNDDDHGLYYKSGENISANLLDVNAALSVGGTSEFSDDVKINNTTGVAILNIEREQIHGDAADVGTVKFRGRDSGGAPTDFAKIYGTAVLDNAGAEEGSLTLQTNKNGSLVTALTLDEDQKATFAGDVSVVGNTTIAADKTLNVDAIRPTTEDGSFYIKQQGTGTTIATFADDLSATFAGSVGALSYTGGNISSTGNIGISSAIPVLTLTDTTTGVIGSFGAADVDYEIRIDDADAVNASKLKIYVDNVNSALVTSIGMSVVGAMTATTYHGDGSALTGISGTGTVTDDYNNYVTFNAGATIGNTASNVKLVADSTEISISSDVDMDGIFQLHTLPNLQTDTAHTLTLADDGAIIVFSNAGATTLTVPLNAAVAFPTYTRIEILQIGAGQVTVTGSSGVTLWNSGTISHTPVIAARGDGAFLFKTATDTWYCVGGLE